MASDAAFFEVLEADLRALCSEARRTDSLATQITGWLQHTDFPQIKDCAERALLKLRSVAQERGGVEALRAKVRAAVGAAGGRPRRQDCCCSAAGTRGGRCSCVCRHGSGKDAK